MYTIAWIRMLFEPSPQIGESIPAWQRARTFRFKDLPAKQQKHRALHCAAQGTCQAQCCLQPGPPGALCRFLLTQKLLLQTSVPLTQLLMLLYLLSKLSKQTEVPGTSDGVAEQLPAGETSAKNLVSQVALQAAKVRDAFACCQMHVALTPAWTAAPVVSYRKVLAGRSCYS